MKFIRNLAIGAAIVTASSGAAFAQQGTIEAVKAKGFVQCGVNTGLLGFAQPDSQGVWKGLDVDLCRGVAAAVLDDANKVRYTPLNATQRFTALQSGEIDVLARNTTYSMSRDTSLGLDFVGVNFYDGQGFMVKRALNVKSAKELNGATICVQSGTTTELNLADFFRSNRLQFTPVVFEGLPEATAAYLSGRCDAYTTDISGLASTRAAQGANANQHVILPDVISKEPLGPSVRQGDPKWADLVRWTHFAMVEAEEYGVTSQNIDSMLTSTNPNIQRLVGATGGFGQMLGVSDKWSYNIIKQVGNYGEIYDRNIKPLGIERGINSQWKDGGLMYAPPIR